MNSLQIVFDRISSVRRIVIALCVATLTVGIFPAILPSAASAGQDGTLLCSHVRGDGKTIVDIDQDMSPRRHGSVDATPTDPVLGAADEVCFLSGTIPAGWTITEAPFPLTLENGSANDGTLIVTSWFNSFEQANYPATVSGVTFTNRGRFIEANDPQGSPHIPVTVENFINAPTGTVSTSNGGELDIIDPSSSIGGSFDNRGRLKIAPKSEVHMQGQGGNSCTAGDALVLENGSTMDDRGILSLECGGLLVRGGAITGTQPVLINPDTIVPITFASSAPVVKPTPSHVIEMFNDGGILHGTVPKGWRVDVPDARILGVANGSGNRGAIVLGSNGSIDGPGATFTNSGTIETAGATNTTASISVKNFVNKAHAVLSATGGAEVSFTYRTSSAATTATIENFGVFKSTKGGLIGFGDGFCPVGPNYDGEKLILERGGEITGSASDVMQCGTFLVEGGTIGAAAPLTVEPSAVTLKFGPNAPAGPGHGANTIQVVGGNAAAVLNGTLARGWTIHVVAGSLGATNGAANAGTIEVSADDQGIDDSGTFTNRGIIVVDAKETGVFVATTFTNHGILKVEDGGLAYFYGPSNGATSVLNKGTFWVTSQAGVELRTAGKLVDEPGSTTKIDVDAAPIGSIVFSEWGDIVLGGTLDLVTPPSFQPAAGSTYQLAQVLASSTLTGSPSKVKGLNTGNGHTYSLNQTGQALTATVK